MHQMYLESRDDHHGEKLFQPFETGAEEEVELPESVYSTVMILPLARDPDHTPLMAFATGFAIFFCMLLLLFNFFIQGSLTYYIFVVGYLDRETRPCLEEYPILMVAGGIIFICRCFSDIMETFDICQWIYYIRTMSTYKELTLIEEDGEYEWESGLTFGFKIYCFVFVVLPKLAIAVSLMIFGTIFIFKAKNEEELLLSIVAMDFVVGVDEVLYETFSPPSVKRVLKMLPAVKIPNTQERQIFSFIILPLMAVSLVVVSFFSIYHGGCDSTSGLVGTVSAAAERFVNNLY